MSINRIKAQEAILKKSVLLSVAGYILAYITSGSVWWGLWGALLEGWYVCYWAIRYGLGSL